MQLTTIIGILFGSLGIALYVWYALALSKLFPIFGIEDWKGYIPFYNTALLFKLAAYNPLFVLIGLVPFVGITAIWVIQVLAMRKLASHYWRDDTETLLLAIFLPPLWVQRFTQVLTGAAGGGSRAKQPAHAAPQAAAAVNGAGSNGTVANGAAQIGAGPNGAGSNGAGLNGAVANGAAQTGPRRSGGPQTQKPQASPPHTPDSETPAQQVKTGQLNGSQAATSQPSAVAATVVSSGSPQTTPQPTAAGLSTAPYRAKRAQFDPQTELLSQSQPPQAAVAPAAAEIRRTGQMQNTSDSDSFADQSMTSSDSSLVMSVGTAAVVEAQLAALDAAALAAETDPTGTYTQSQLITDAAPDESHSAARSDDEGEHSHVGDVATSHIAPAAPAHAAVDPAAAAKSAPAASGLREPKTVTGENATPAHAAPEHAASERAADEDAEQAAAELAAAERAADYAAAEQAAERAAAEEALARAAVAEEEIDDSAVAGEAPASAAAAAPIAAAAAPVTTVPVASEQHAAVQQDEAAQDGDGLFHELDNTDDSTVVVPREDERPEWEIVLADGTAFTLQGDDIVVGRDPKTAGAKLKLPDVTKTLSRSHARFTYVESEDSWQIEDLGSQNGTVIYPPGVVEHELTAGVKETATSQMLLGTLPVTLRHKD